MATKPRTVDIAEVSDIGALAEEVNRTQQPCLVQRDGHDLVLISPVRPKTKAKRPRTSGIVTEDDPLFRLFGIGEGNVPGGISERKHEAFLEAHYRIHREQ